MTCHRWIIGFSWWGWRYWRYTNFQRGITALGPLTIFWGRMEGRRL